MGFTHTAWKGLGEHKGVQFIGNFAKLYSWRISRGEFHTCGTELGRDTGSLTAGTGLL